MQGQEQANINAILNLKTLDLRKQKLQGRKVDTRRPERVILSVCKKLWTVLEVVIVMTSMKRVGPKTLIQPLKSFQLTRTMLMTIPLRFQTYMQKTRQLICMRLSVLTSLSSIIADWTNQSTHKLTVSFQIILKRSSLASSLFMIKILSSMRCCDKWWRIRAVLTAKQ